MYSLYRNKKIKKITSMIGQVAYIPIWVMVSQNHNHPKDIMTTVVCYHNGLWLTFLHLSDHRFERSDHSDCVRLRSNIELDRDNLIGTYLIVSETVSSDGDKSGHFKMSKRDWKASNAFYGNEGYR